SGSVDENVFAYSNTESGQAALVVYHNRYGSTSGWIKTSVPYLVKGSENAHLETSELADALQLGGDSNTFVTFRDYIEKLEYIRSVQDIREHGMFFALDAYKHHVFMDFRLVSGREYEELNAHLNGRGVSNLDVARREIVLGPVLQPLGQVINPTNLNNLIELAQEREDPTSLESLLRVNLDLIRQAGYAMQRQGLALGGDIEASSKQLEKCLRQILDLESLDKKLGLSGKKIAPLLSKALQEIDPRAKFVLLIWNFLSNLAGPANEAENTQTARRFLDEEPTSQLVTETLKGLGFGDYEAYKACQAIKWMLINTNWLTEKDLTPSKLLEQWLQDEQFKEYLELNEYNQVYWFNKEKFESMLWYMHIATILRYASDPSISSVEQVEAILRAEPIFARLQKAFAQSEFRLDQLQAALD
ncbi:MAG TPA: hypothetical protein PK273_01060, partial [Anaerolineaceae bacterium]|nr:hypothetical protein [Anaerolineaceae bacterium]